MIRAAVITVGALSIVPLASPAASAAQAVPSPVVTVQTSVAGRPLPVSGIAAKWTVARPGQVATMTASGMSAAGTNTVIRSEWVSRWRPTVPGRLGLTLEVEDDGQPLTPGTGFDGWRYEVEVRIPHGSWSRLSNAQWTQTYDPLIHITLRERTGWGLGGRSSVQWRVQFLAEQTNTARVALRETVRES